MLIIYRRESFYVALGTDAFVLSKLLDKKLHVACKDRTVAYYVAFHWNGTEERLKFLVYDTVGLKVVFK